MFVEKKEKDIMSKNKFKSKGKLGLFDEKSKIHCKVEHVFGFI